MPAPDSIKPSRPPEAQACALEEAVQLTGPGWDYTLFAEEVLIGRDPTCRVVVDDPLVSREHAKLKIRHDKVMIVDCRSANGVYVNNVRIFEPCQLFEGDRILIGTTELCVFAPEPPPQERSRPQSSVPAPTKSAPAAAPPAATERAAALEVLGRLADRMLADGSPKDAERVLTDHLSKILDGARSGLPVPAELCQAASRYALKLARALHDGKWMNYTIELHLRGELPISPMTFAELAYAAELAQGVDHALYSYYVEWLREAVTRFPPGTEEVIEQLDALKLPSSRRER